MRVRAHTQTLTKPEMVRLAIADGMGMAIQALAGGHLSCHLQCINMFL